MSVRKVVDVSLHMSITRSHADLEYLISRWSTKTHTFVTSWGEFTPIPRDVSVIFRLQVSVDDGAMGFIMFDKERGKVQLPSAALKLSNKSTYTSWARYLYSQYHSSFISSSCLFVLCLVLITAKRWFLSLTVVVFS